jgi:hypothetical protein
MIGNHRRTKELRVAQEEGFMKVMYFVLLTLAAFLAGPASAQEIKTVATCRAYREAWFTSSDKDVNRLPIRELVQRANQMMTCGKDIDTQPFTAGMTAVDAAKMGVEQSGYAILASAYLQEAFTRASWFIENKRLTPEFLAADSKGKILKPSH